MTQAQLANAVGFSQPYISQVERGDAAVPQEVVEFLRGRPQSPPAARPQALWHPPFINVPHWLTMRWWQRPVDSGDAITLVPLKTGGALILALDMAGHGEEQAPKAGYLQGWVRGYAAADPERRIEATAADLAAELEATKLEAAWLLVRLNPIQPGCRTKYEAVGHAFPSPLLMVGLPPQTQRSMGTAFEPVTHVLQSPWRLVVATDGLLRRLGAGDENSGKRALATWHSGAKMDDPPATRLSTSAPLADDELYADLTWSKWDGYDNFRILNDERRHRALRVLRQWLHPHLREQTGHMLAVVGEALSNARRHAYRGGDGDVVVAWRDEEDRVRVEVQDSGSGSIRPSGRIGLMEHHADSVFVRSGETGGTIVSLMMRKQRP